MYCIGAHIQLYIDVFSGVRRNWEISETRLKVRQFKYSLSVARQLYNNVTRRSASADRKCASNMALSHGGVAVQKAFQSETV